MDSGWDNSSHTHTYLKVLRRHEGHRELVLVDKVLGSVLVADPRPCRVGSHVFERREEVVQRLLGERKPLRVVDGEARQWTAFEETGWRRRSANASGAKRLASKWRASIGSNINAYGARQSHCTVGRRQSISRMNVWKDWDDCVEGQ